MEITNRVKKKYVLILVALSLLSFIWSGIFLNKNSSLKGERDSAVLKADSILSAKLLLNKQLDEVNAELGKYKNEQAQTNESIISLKTDISDKTVQIEKLTKDNTSLSSLRKQIKDGKKQKEDCETRANELNRKIQSLENQISQLNNQLSELKKENETLKKKLEFSKDIKARTIAINNFRIVKSKTKATDKAKRVNRISATIELMENPVVDGGAKKVYLVVYSGNKTLSDAQSKFTEKKSGSEMYYSAMKDINYNNSDQNIIINYDFEQKRLKGKYKAEVYVDGSLAGKTEFMLK